MIKMSKSVFFFAAIAACLAVLFLWNINGDAAKTDSNRQFENARQLVFSGQFDAAARGFENFLTENPGHKFSSRAMFMLGKSKFGSGDETAALKSFEKTIAQYLTSLEAAKAKYKIAMIEWLRGNRRAAREQMQKIVNDANGPYTPEATAWLRYLDKTPEAIAK